MMKKYNNTKMILIETPTNPMMQLADIKAVSEFAKSNSLISVVDNTFMSPYFQRPLTMGVDLVIHKINNSAKYLT